MYKNKQQFFITYRRLSQQVARRKKGSNLRKALGVILILLGLSAASAQAQVEFGPVQDNPFGLTVHNTIRYETLADIDDDGDLDIISIVHGWTGVALEYVENQSVDAGATAMFATPDPNFLGVDLPELTGSSLSRPELVDIDGDGDLDLFIGHLDYENGGKVFFFKNEGTSTTPDFGEIQKNPYEINLLGTDHATPNLADMDGDGDFDLLSLSRRTIGPNVYDDGILYQENIGTATIPVFDTPIDQVFGLPDTYEEWQLCELGDIDNDGDIDIMVGKGKATEDYYTIEYEFYENIGNATNPMFADVVVNPYGLTSIPITFTWPMLGDLDNDGDLDILNGTAHDLITQEAGWAYQENLLLNVTVNDLAGEFTYISVAPTVSTGTFQLQMRTESVPLAVTLRVFDNQGQLLQQQSYNTTTELEEQVNLQAYPAGTYHLNLASEGKQWTGTVVKQ